MHSTERTDTKAQEHKQHAASVAKDMPRLLQLGEAGFWKLMHHISNVSDEARTQWRADLENACIHIWCGKENPEEAQDCLTLLSALTKDIPNFTLTLHDVQDMGAAQLTATLETLPASDMHVACGFTEISLDVLMSAAAGPCLVGTSTVSAPYAALAELAFILHRAQAHDITIDSIRVCWLGAVTGLAQSLMEAAIYAPFELFMGIPPWGDPNHYNTGLALKAGAKIFLTREPELAIDGADLIYLDPALEKAATKNSTIPIGMASYDWQQGFNLSAPFKERANKHVLTVPTTLSTEAASDTDTHREKRLQWREAALLALLARMATVQSA